MDRGIGRTKPCALEFRSPFQHSPFCMQRHSANAIPASTDNSWPCSALVPMRKRHIYESVRSLVRPSRSTAPATPLWVRESRIESDLVGVRVGRGCCMFRWHIWFGSLSGRCGRGIDSLRKHAPASHWLPTSRCHTTVDACTPPWATAPPTQALNDHRSTAAAA